MLFFRINRFSQRFKPVHKKNTIKKEEFLEWTKSVWTFPAVSARQIGHPAPFPEELPHRLIQLYTFKGDVVLDPFVGSGSTCLSAIKDERNYIGYDINPDYVKFAESFGAIGIRLTNHDELEDTLSSALSADRPVVSRSPSLNWTPPGILF